MTTIVTLALDQDAQRWFDEQRRMHFPPLLNQTSAHLTLFHQLPGGAATALMLKEAAAGVVAFPLRVDGVRSMGRGVMYTLSSPELLRLHEALATRCRAFLIPQDRQPLRPHVVIQNKVEPAEAKLLLARLQLQFQPRLVQAMGLEWWEYMGGPWRLLERIPFRCGQAGPQ